MNPTIWMGIVLVLASMPESVLAQGLYKHVDETGKITYSDQPQHADDKTEEARSPNVASPEARQQMYEEACRNREEKKEERYGQPRNHEQREREEVAYMNCVNRKSGTPGRLAP